jgi:hypothetical protein
VSSEQIRDALKGLCAAAVPSANAGSYSAVGGEPASSDAWLDIPPYAGDALVRRSEALAKTKDGQLARVVL